MTEEQRQRDEAKPAKRIMFGKELLPGETIGSRLRRLNREDNRIVATGERPPYEDDPYSWGWDDSCLENDPATKV